jgi:Ca2+-binding RTX toxin-like protein
MSMRPVLLCMLALALAPAVGHAAVIEAPADCNRYDDCSYEAVVRAQPGEANHLTIAVVEGRPVFSDPGVLVQAGENCTSESDHVVWCLAEVARVRVLAGDRDDAVDASGYNHSVTIDGGAGDDELSGGAGNDELTGGRGDDEEHGGAGRDEVSFAEARTPVRVDLRAQTARLDRHLERFDGIESVRTGSGDDVLSGDVHSNDLAGGPGNDRLYGSGGDDNLAAGRGADVLRGGRGDDTLEARHSRTHGARADDIACGHGHDFVVDADAPALVHGDCERLAADNLTWPVDLWQHGGRLRIRRDMLGSHMHLTVKLFMGGRPQRVFHRRVASHGTFPPGVFSLGLSTPGVELARATGAVRVTVTILATAPRGDFAVTLHLLLARAP